ncbi:MAG: fibronectin type III domain-containing protein [Bacillota bacterium]|nr:fibronectin type III domain-containing protein [Bacillota bacterium]
MNMLARKTTAVLLALTLAVTFIPVFNQSAFAETEAGSKAQLTSQGQYVLSDDTTDIWVDDLTYNGKKQIPEVEVYYDWDLLTQDRDYILRFIDSNGNTISADEGICNAGQYLMMVIGIGDYTGTITKTINIKTVPITSVNANQQAVIYNGKRRYKTITVKAKLNGTVRTLKKGTEYTVAYKNNKNVGKATITIKGKGNYKGTFKRTFKIRPRATWLRSVKPRPCGFKAKWAKKTTQVSGYQIQYSRKSSFSTRKTITIKSNRTIKRSFKNLKGGKKYYVRVRTYKKVNGTKYFSKWSAKKVVRAKRPTLKKYILGRWINKNDKKDLLVIKKVRYDGKTHLNILPYYGRSDSLYLGPMANWGLKITGTSSMRVEMFSYKYTWKVTSAGLLRAKYRGGTIKYYRKLGSNVHLTFQGQ